MYMCADMHIMCIYIYTYMYNMSVGCVPRKAALGQKLGIQPHGYTPSARLHGIGHAPFMLALHVSFCVDTWGEHVTLVNIGDILGFFLHVSASSALLPLPPTPPPGIPSG